MSNTVSEVSICNNALARIGADVIRSFDDDNRRSRICKILYDQIRDQVLFYVDWAFARKFAKIRAVYAELTGLVLPEGITAYAMPDDCICPRDVGPIGSREWWTTQGCYVWMKAALEEVDFYYTYKCTSTVYFSQAFIEVMIAGLAAALAMPIAQDKSMASTLYQQYQLVLHQAMADDANQGSPHQYPDDIPELDTYVHPENKIPMLDQAFPWRRYID
jgi:hypothetical protein